MNPALLWKLAETFALLSLVAVGGANAAVPEIHRLVVVQEHWMSEATFTQLFAISQAAPGPNILLVSLVGWRLAGFAGLMVSTLAMNLPSCTLAFAGGRAWSAWSDSPWIGRLQKVLAPIAIGLITASGWVMATASDHMLWPWAITALVAAFVLCSKRSPMWALAAAALAGIVLHRLGVAF